MATATLTPAVSAPAVSKGKGKPAPAKPEALTPDQIAKEAAALRTRYTTADKGEAQAWEAKELADLLWQNARVIKVRVAYAAAMLTPVPSGADKGKANLLAATRFLLLTDEERAATPAKVKAIAVKRKSTLRNYVAAGEALQEKGLATRMTEPDEEERKIVAAVFREMNKRDKAEAAGDKEPGDKEPGTGDKEPADSDALDFTALLAHFQRAVSTVDMLKASKVVITTEDLDLLTKVSADLLRKVEDLAV